LSKTAQILHVFGRQIFFWSDPKFWDEDYKNKPISDHVAKFHGNWLKNIGNLALKKRHPQ